MRKKLLTAGALMLLLMVSVTPAAGASRYPDRYVDGDIHFELKLPDKASCRRCVCNPRYGLPKSGYPSTIPGRL